jgi:xanthine/CO dehydrogenase XdhC/CoxF family maturation factor
MSELRSLVAAADSLRQAGEPFLVATLVSVKGSSYRRPGARLLIAEDRWVAGSISGGCLERDLVRRAWWCLGEGEAALVSYDSTSDDDDVGWGIGLGCNGVVELLLERTGAGRPSTRWHSFVAAFGMRRLAPWSQSSARQAATSLWGPAWRWRPMGRSSPART